MRSLLLMLMILALLTTQGCYDAVDLNEQIFAVNLALDKGESAALRLTLQVPQVTPTGMQPAQTDSDLQKNGYVLHKVEGDTLSECLQLMHMVMPRRLSLMHLRGVYISEAAAQDEELLHECLAVLDDAQTVRTSALLYITRGDAQAVLQAQLPLFGARLSKAQQAQSKALLAQGVIPEASLKGFAQALGQPCGAAVAVLAAVNGQVPEDTAQPAAYLAGELPRITADRVDLCGSALIGKEGLVLLNGYETQLMNLLRGDIKELTMTIDGRPTTLTLRRKPHIRVRTGVEAPCIEITLSARIQDAPNDGLTEAFCQDILSLLLKLQQNGLDPLNLTGRAKVHALMLAQWEAMDWKEAYRKAIWSVSAQ